MERFAADMVSNLYGNPHSGSASSQLSTKRIEDIRLRILQFFNADPEDFDIVFVANATAGVKLVMDAFRACEGGFIYGYHNFSHTSLVGVRENAKLSQCLGGEDVESWLTSSRPLVDGSDGNTIGLFSFPAQSNMDGRRLPLSWSGRVRQLMISGQQRVYTLLDAAALVSTSRLDLSDVDNSPDFTVVSFNKIFGFPNLGALIVRKESGKILQSRKYFGGGTVEMVVCMKEQWHAPKEQTLHEALEDGTLPIHSIVALDTAMKIHTELYESIEKVSQHTMFLARRLDEGLRSLRHANDENVCEMYTEQTAFSRSANNQGPTIAFNLKNSHGAWISNTEVEKLAAVRNIHIRTGGLCNPGGIASALNLAPWEMRKNFSAGFRCGNDNDIMASGKPTGVIRASLGAMSNITDVDSFLSFIREFYLEDNSPQLCHELVDQSSGLYVDSLTVYPIKSCGGFQVPRNTDWEVKKEGLAWDREWCLVHQGTGQALSQKRYPSMALIRPRIDFVAGLLLVKFHGEVPLGCETEIKIPLSADPTVYRSSDAYRSVSSRVCGDVIIAHTYSSKTVNSFFTEILGVPCSLARFPAGGAGSSARHAKAHMQRHQRTGSASTAQPSEFEAPPTPPDSDSEIPTRPILLSNESPILSINKSSIDALNEEIRKAGGKEASASVFRANIVIASSDPEAQQKPYSEDFWSSLKIGAQDFRMLGSCRRCHMICVDQETAIKDEEPFVTLAKTRRFEGKVFFGSHMCHVSRQAQTKEGQYPTIRVGDPVVKLMED
jgi:molybdenum cofactor sulfurtransferase